MSYGLLGIKSKLEGEAMQGLQDLSRQQAQAKAHSEQLQAAEKAQQMQTIGMGAGMGAMAGSAMMGAKMGAMAGPAGMLIGAGIGYLASEIF